ncbi:hypothetical protein FRC10_001012 [Ceratobasidium sp. 414]|nr:hypothetical protein FRC10_001012 [Ceratobasidium sp. 414]
MEPMSGPWYLRAGLWATRSHSARLYIHASNHGTPKPTRPGVTVREFVAFLRPLAPRMAGLEMVTQGPAFQDHVFGAVSSWVRHGSHGSARRLKIGGTGDFHPKFMAQDLRTQLLSTNEQVTSSEFESFFQSVGALYLNGLTPPPLDSAIYHGLTELRINGPGGRAPHSQRQLAAVLAACPKLRTLTLYHFVALDPDFPPVPIALNDLKSLALDSRSRVLPLIASSSQSIDVSICTPHPHDVNLVAEARAFFARCKVTRLYIGTPIIQDYLATWLGHIPHVQTLALSYSPISDDTLREYVNAHGTESSLLDPWPRLQNLILRFCVTSQGCVQRLISMHPLQELHIVAFGRFVLWNTAEEREQFENQLRASIPRVVCTENHAEDPTKEWDFVYPAAMK